MLKFHSPFCCFFFNLLLRSFKSHVFSGVQRETNRLLGELRLSCTSASSAGWCWNSSATWFPRPSRTSAVYAQERQKRDSEQQNLFRYGWDFFWVMEVFETHPYMIWKHIWKHCFFLAKVLSECLFFFCNVSGQVLFQESEGSAQSRANVFASKEAGAVPSSRKYLK